MFTDPVVEAIIRSQLAIDAGAGISADDVLMIEDFSDDAPALLQSDGNRLIIYSLDDLKHCSNLKSVALCDQSIANLDGLRDLSLLESVVIIDCALLNDISPLSEMKHLQQAVLLSTPIQEYGPVLALDSLTTFVASGFFTTQDLSPLTATSNLEKFFLRGVTAETDYTPLRNHRKMKEVELSFIDPAAFRELVSSFPDLRMFDISHSAIIGGDLAALSSHVLTHVKLYRCNIIDDLYPFSSHAEMQALYIVECNLADIGFVENMTSLATVDLRGNPVRDFTPLFHLPNLQKLIISQSDGIDEDELRKNLPNTEIVLGLYHQADIPSQIAR